MYDSAIFNTNLSQQLFGPATWLNIVQWVVGILYHAMSKGTEPQLDHGPVVQDLKTQV